MTTSEGLFSFLQRTQVLILVLEVESNLVVRFKETWNALLNVPRVASAAEREIVVSALERIAQVFRRQGPHRLREGGSARPDVPA